MDDYDLLDSPPDTVLAELAASPARRAFGCGVLAALALLLIWLGLGAGISAGWGALPALAGAVAGLGAWLMWRATGVRLILRPGGLSDSTGRDVARLPDMVAVDRGMFAFKPTHGFAIRLRCASGGAWAPGLWWRMGRRVGVGGVTPAGQAKAMAETLTFLLARRDGG